MCVKIFHCYGVITPSHSFKSTLEDLEINNRSQELCSFSLVVTLELKKKKKKGNKLWKEEQKLAVDGKEILWALKTGFKIGTLEVREFKGQLLMGLKGLGLGAA